VINVFPAPATISTLRRENTYARTNKHRQRFIKSNPFLELKRLKKTSARVWDQILEKEGVPFFRRDLAIPDPLQRFLSLLTFKALNSNDVA
jgi:hypothetical protein